MYNIIKILHFIIIALVPVYAQSAGIRVNFYNVGQGNCTLVVPPAGPPLLVDYGSLTFPVIDPNKNKYTTLYLDEEKVKNPINRNKLKNDISLDIINHIRIWHTIRKDITTPSINVVLSHGDQDHYKWIPIIAELLEPVLSIANNLYDIKQELENIRTLAERQISTLKNNKEISNLKKDDQYLEKIIKKLPFAVSTTTGIATALRDDISELLNPRNFHSNYFNDIHKKSLNLVRTQKIRPLVTKLESTSQVAFSTPLSTLGYKNFKAQFFLVGKRSDYTKELLKAINKLRSIYYPPTFYPQYTDNPDFPEIIHCGPEVDCKILSQIPTSGIPDKDKNTKSIVLYISYAKKSVVLTGDATGETTQYIIDNTKNIDISNVHIMQASHHGADSDKSNNIDWFENTTPEILVLSSSIREGWNHPKLQVIKNFLSGKRTTNSKPIYSNNNLYHNIHSYQDIENFKMLKEIIIDNVRFPETRFKSYVHFFKGYQIALTNLGIYSTMDQGCISFSWDYTSQTNIEFNLPINSGTIISSNTTNITSNLEPKVRAKSLQNKGKFLPQTDAINDTTAANLVQIIQHKIIEETLEGLVENIYKDKRDALISLNLRNLDLQNSHVKLINKLASSRRSSLLSLDLSGNSNISDDVELKNIIQSFTQLNKLKLYGTGIIPNLINNET